jgi:hypothetical protein
MIMDTFVDTWKKVITSPSAFYESMPKEGGYSEPLKFAIINFIVLGIGSAIISILYNLIGFSLLGNMSMLGGSTVMATEFTLMSVISDIIIIPITSIIGLFIFGAILFILFKIVGGAGSYEGTVRILSYSSAVSLLAWIPLIGMLAGLYGLYLDIVGGTYVHNISTLRSAIAVLLPVVLLIILLIILVMVLVIAFSSSSYLEGVNTS